MIESSTSVMHSGKCTACEHKSKFALKHRGDKAVMKRDKCDREFLIFVCIIKEKYCKIAHACICDARRDDAETKTRLIFDFRRKAHYMN